jgi:hypothetical protein
MKINHHQPLGGDLLRRFKLAVVARHGSWLLEGGVPGWIFVGLCCHIHLSASLSYFIAKNPTSTVISLFCCVKSPVLMLNCFTLHFFQPWKMWHQRSRRVPRFRRPRRTWNMNGST